MTVRRIVAIVALVVLASACTMTETGTTPAGDARATHTPS